MASQDFALRILTPGKELFKGDVSDVVIPAHDGEAGIMQKHENFVGLLGTGVLKLVKGGDDYWFVVSSGIYQIKDDEVTILAEMGEAAKDVDVEAARQEAAELEPLFGEKNSFSSDYKEFKVTYERAKARIEIHRRTNDVH